VRVTRVSERSAFSPDDDPLADLSPEERREVEGAGTVTEEDVNDALRQWRQDAPAAVRDIMDAGTEEEA
jgi:hypothetical protein